MASARLSVVIATLDRPETLRRCLHATLAQEPPPLEVLVVDGSASQSARAVVAEHVDAAVPVRHLTSARGLTRQRNVGIDEAQGDVVVFVDDDAMLRPGALAAVARVYAEPEVVGVTGRVEEPPSNRRFGKESRLRGLVPGGGVEGTMTRFGYPRRLVHVDVARDVEFMSGCFMSARLPLAREVRFDERLPGYGLAEDEDFGYRLSRRGRVRYEPGAVVDHENSGFGGRDRRAFGRTVVVNRAYLLQKNFTPGRLARAQFVLLVVGLAVHRLANRDPAGARGVLTGALEAHRSWRTREWAL